MTSPSRNQDQHTGGPESLHAHGSHVGTAPAHTHPHHGIAVVSHVPVHHAVPTHVVTAHGETQIHHAAAAAGGPPGGAPHPMAVFMQVATAKFATAILGVVARFNVADHVGPNGTPAAEIAGKVGLHPDALYRIMRALTMVGFFEELPNKSFKNSPASELLRSDNPHSMNHFARWVTCEAHNLAYNKIDEAAKTGDQCWTAAHGGNDIWKFFEQDKATLEVFQGAMTDLSRNNIPMIGQHYDFKRFNTICDVGGGHGEMLAVALRAAKPDAKGVLFELPEVLKDTAKVNATLGDVVSRVTLTPGDMFKEAPKNVDLFILKHIVHDWSDEKSKVFLSNIAKSLNKGGRVVVFEFVMPGPNIPSPAKMVDVEMLAVTHGGRERTLEEMQALFATSGLKFVQMVDLPSPIKGFEAELA